MKEDIIIVYANGIFEVVDDVNDTLIRQVKNGVIRYIFNTDNGTAIVLTSDKKVGIVNIPGATFDEKIDPKKEKKK